MGGGFSGGSGGFGGGSSSNGAAGGAVNEITSTLQTLASNPSVRDNEVLQTLIQTMSKVQHNIVTTQCQ